MTREPSDPHGPTGRLACWVHALDLDAVPASVVDRVVHLILDGVGCALIGAQLPWSRLATEATLGLDGSGSAIVIGTGRTTTPPASAVLNSTFIQGFELDDFHPLAPLHTMSLILPAALATLDQLDRPVSGPAFVTAVLAALEVGPRVGHALGGSEMLSRGWHSGSVFGTHAAAVVSGRLRGLDPAALEDALGLAGTQSAGLMAAQYEAASKRMHHGFAARAGYYAAGLAEAGYTGIKRVFERDYGGFLSVFGEGHQPDSGAITAGLGDTWETDVVMVKSYAAMGGLHPVIQAARAIRDEVDVEDIERIDIRVGDVIYHHGWWKPERPLTPIGAQMNLGYAVAAALVDGNVLPEQFTAQRLDADDLWRLIERVDVELDPAIDELPVHERFQTHLTLTLSDGTTIRESVIQPHGSPLDPVSNDEIEDKFSALTERVMPAARSAAVKRAVLDLLTVDDLGRLTDLLAEPVARAID